MGRFSILIFAFLLLCSCKHVMLPHSYIEDTSFNREIVAFMKKYKQALESRDVDNILSLASKNYIDAAPLEPNQKVTDRASLKKKLSSSLQRIKNYQIDIFIQNVERNGNKVKVVYFYQQRALISLPSGDKWDFNSDTKQIVLKVQKKKGKNEFKILQGL